MTEDRWRYTPLAQALHWIVAVLMFTALPLAWVMVSLPRSAPNRELLFTLHKSVGLTILALAILRTVWRLTHKPPRRAPEQAAWSIASPRPRMSVKRRHAVTPQK